MLNSINDLNMNGKIASEIKQIYNLQILQSVHSINSDLQLPRAHRGPRNGVRSCSTMLPKWNKICCVHCAACASFLKGITNNNKRNRKSVVPNFFEVKMKRDSCREEPLPITLGEKNTNRSKIFRQRFQHERKGKIASEIKRI